MLSIVMLFLSIGLRVIRSVLPVQYFLIGWLLSLAVYVLAVSQRRQRAVASTRGRTVSDDEEPPPWITTEIPEVVITPVMNRELQRDRPWIAAAATAAAVQALVLVAIGATRFAAGVITGTKDARIAGLASGGADVLLGLVFVVLIVYAMRWSRCVAEARGLLTTARFVAVVDSQRSMLRFFTTTFVFAAFAIILSLFSTDLTGEGPLP